jgi:hypothetical protein
MTAATSVSVAAGGASRSGSASGTKTADGIVTAGTVGTATRCPRVSMTAVRQACLTPKDSASSSLTGANMVMSGNDKRLIFRWSQDCQSSIDVR